MHADRTVPAAPRDAVTPRNPYAPPDAGADGPPDADGRSRVALRPFGGAAIKWMCLAVAAVSHLALLGAALGGPPAGMAAVFSSTMLLGSILGLCWLHEAWMARPFPRNHRQVSPGGAVGRLFIPLYGVFYWTFAASMEVGAAIEPPDGAKTSSSRRDAPRLRGLAVAGSVLQVVTYLAGFASPGAGLSTDSLLTIALGTGRAAAWIALMFLWERARVRTLAPLR